METNNSKTESVEEVLSHVRRGWSLVPLKGKKPVLEGWTQLPKTTESEAKQYVEQGNIGIRTGAISGLVVIDVDLKGLKFLKELNLPPTPRVRTGSGGLHFYFKYPEGGLSNSVGKLAPGIDLRGDGGQIVAPPSIHPATKKPYEWEVSPDICLLAEFPREILEKLNEDKNSNKIAHNHPSDTLPEGRRNELLFKVASTLRRNGMDKVGIFNGLKGMNIELCQVPLDQNEIWKIARSVAKYPPIESDHDSKSNSFWNVSEKEAESDNTRRIDPVPFSVFRSRPKIDKKWLVKDLLPVGGISLLGAKPGVGKSTLARNLALCVSRGESFLERDTMQGPVIYLAIEEIDCQLEDKLSKMGVQNEPILIQTGSISGGNQNILDDLDKAIKENKPSLVIVDPIFKFLKIAEVNSYAETSDAFDRLCNLARSNTCHILCVHHLTKSKEVDSLLGSTAIEGSVDTTLIMKKNAEMRTIQTDKLRYGEPLAKLTLQFDPKTEIVGPLKGQSVIREQASSNKYAHRIIDLFSKNGNNEFTEAEIKGQAGGNGTMVSKAIRSLLKDGLLQRSLKDNSKKALKGNPYLYSLAADRSAKVKQPITH
jgi:hypothetical protein